MGSVSAWVPVVTAVVSGVLVGGVSLATNYLANQSARQLAEENAQEQRRALLHADRITAYQHFRHAFLDAQSASGRSNMFWSARVGAERRNEEEDFSADALKNFDSINSAWMEAVNDSVVKDRLLQLALGDLELVASGPVRSAAAAMRGKADELRKAHLDAANAAADSVDRWLIVNNRRQELEQLEESLVAAIQRELSVDSSG